jgi:hypothetical protein
MLQPTPGSVIRDFVPRSGAKLVITCISLAFIVIAVSCRNTARNFVDIGYIRFSPAKISITDSSGAGKHQNLQDIEMDMTIDTIGPGLFYLKINMTADKPVRLKNVEIPFQFMADSTGITEKIKRSFHWAPNLKLDSTDIFSRHVFRSPAIILTYGRAAVSIVPDLKLMGSYNDLPYYLDLKFSEKETVASFGLSNYKVKNHVYYELSDSLFTLPGKMELGLYLISENNSSPLQILKKTNSLLWNKWGVSFIDSIAPQVVPFSRYASEGYSMALSKYWVDGPVKGTGGITLSTYFDKPTGVYRGRDYKDDLWFHSWFNNARTAYGLYLWGKETGNILWIDKALSVMNLLLRSPVKNGFFETIWVPEKNGWIISGQGGGTDLYHVPDNAWTAIWLLRFNDELKKIGGADKFLEEFAEGLMKIQSEDGSFPERVRASDFSPDPVLAKGGSGGMATWFLEEMIERKKMTEEAEAKARETVLKSLSFLENEILPAMKFQDYEVFFSCAPNPPGRFDPYTWLYPHNTLSIQWCAEAFLKASKIFGRSEFLEKGEYCLNILSLYQQVWNPPFIGFYAFGGFGVQNTDAEWSDARQAQFAETYLNFFMSTGNREYLQRGIAACKASFALMVIPENRDICPNNYQGTIFNGEFRGAMAENYGHSGYDKRSGQSGFHWGTGSALTTAAIFKKRLGDIYIEGNSHTASGIDGVVVDETLWGDTIKLRTRMLHGHPMLKIKGAGDELAGKKVILNKEHTPILVEISR